MNANKKEERDLHQPAMIDKREGTERGGEKEVEVGPWGNNFLCGYGLMCVNNFLL